MDVTRRISNGPLPRTSQYRALTPICAPITVPFVWAVAAGQARFCRGGWYRPEKSLVAAVRTGPVLAPTRGEDHLLMGQLMDQAPMPGQISGEALWDASTAMSMRLRVNELLAAAAVAPGLATSQLQELAELVNTGRLAEADAALTRLHTGGWSP